MADWRDIVSIFDGAIDVYTTEPDYVIRVRTPKSSLISRDIIAAEEKGFKLQSATIGNPDLSFNELFFRRVA